MIYCKQKDIEQISKNIKFLSEKINGKKFLITGGDGFIGQYMQEVLNYFNLNILKKPCKVCIIDITIKKKIKDKNFIYIKNDILKINKFPLKFDYIIHTAGIPSPSRYYANPVDALLISINGTKKLLDLSLSQRSRFTFFSSSEIYGNPDDKNIPTKENYCGYVNSMGDRACYDEGKRVGETLCYIYNKYNDIVANVIRPFNIVGPGMDKLDDRVFPNFFRKIINNEKISIYLDGKQTRSYCYINDAMYCFFNIILRGKGMAYNVGNSNSEVSVYELVNIIKKTLGIKIKTEFKSYPKDYPKTEPQRRCPNINLAKKEFEYKPYYNLKAIIKNFYYWAVENYK